MPTPEKEARVAALKESIDSAAGIYLCDFAGITADGMNELRGKVIDAGGRIEIAKNRLLKIAFAGTDGEGLSEYLTGATAVTFCGDDPITPAQAMKEFAKGLESDEQRWVIKAALVEGDVLDTGSAQALADLPSLDEIKGAVVGGLAGPMNAVVGALNAALSDLVFTLQAVAEKQESAAN